MNKKNNSAKKTMVEKMIINRKKSIMTALILGLALSIPVGTTLARPASPINKKSIPLFPLDLKVGRMNAAKDGSAGGNDRVKITVQVVATTSRPAGIHCTGPFKVKVSKDMGGRWVDIGIGGVADLCVGKKVAAATQTLIFSDLVPANFRGARKYRAEVDFDNRVREANEGNNFGGTRYIAR